MAYTSSHEHYNDTDTIYALPIADPPWTDAGIIVGDDSAVSGFYEFTGLQDGVDYYVCVQIGAEPAEGDYQDAIIVAPLLDSPGVLELLERITAPIQTADEADADQAAVLGAIADAGGEGGLFPVQVLTPEQAGGACGKVITIVQGDDYTDARKLPIEIDSVADIVGQYVILAIKRSGEIGVSFRSQVYIGDDTNQYFDINMPSDITSQMGAGDWQYIVRLESEISKESRISSGIWRVIGFATPVPVQGTER